jgi:hypothetical protein
MRPVRTPKYGYPYHSRPFGIFGLAGFCELISGLQSLRGKILSRCELAGGIAAFAWVYAAVFEIMVCLLYSCSEISALTRNSGGLPASGLRASGFRTSGFRASGSGLWALG